MGYAGKYKTSGPRLNGETRVGESRLGLCRKDSKRLKELGGSPRTCFAIEKYGANQSKTIFAAERRSSPSI